MSDQGNHKKNRKPRMLLLGGCLSGLVPLALWVMHLFAWLGQASGLAFMRETGLSQLAAVISLFNVLAIGSLVHVFSRLKKIPWVKQVHNPKMKDYLRDCGGITENMHRIWIKFFWGCSFAFIPPLATFLLYKGTGHFLILAGIVFAAFSMAASYHFAIKAVDSLEKDPFPGNICRSKPLWRFLFSHPRDKDNPCGAVDKRVNLLSQISELRKETENVN